ncbi:MAG TPA: type II toxin-antitoxin system HicA family toxin [Pirellulales bacterium]|jgi:predicted RNA binding protein YcfA (HicA-like mRNA interferase family)
MKRRDLLKHLRSNGCRFVREGGSHSVWEHAGNRRQTTVPRHREIPEFTAKRICQQLEIPNPTT